MPIYVKLPEQKVQQIRDAVALRANSRKLLGTHGLLALLQALICLIGEKGRREKFYSRPWNCGTSPRACSEA
jgi:hypothetical protein